VIFFDQFSRLLMTCVAADDTCGADQRQDDTPQIRRALDAL
jgi:hypothetical protein